MKFILGTKQDMTQVFKDDGTVVPVTRVQAGPCVITQVKTADKDGVKAVQVGFGVQKFFRLNKPQKGHVKDLVKDNIVPRYLRDCRVEDDNDLKRGDVFTVNIFEPGEKVQVMGHAKGKGFQGVVKRHGFAGSLASHGHKDQLRMPGSIGATDAARVFKGTRMGGHMGDNRVTVKNLEIVEIHPDTNELLIKGAVPGAKGSLLVVTTPEGKIEVKSEQAEEPEVKVEEQQEDAQKTKVDDNAVEQKPEQAVEAQEKAEETEEKPQEAKPEVEENQEPAKEEVKEQEK